GYGASGSRSEAGAFPGPYSVSWATLIWPHAPSFPMIPTKGIFCRIALSYSIALRPNEPSPYTTRTCLSGFANFAAIANEGPTPRQPNGPGSSQCPGYRPLMI